MQHQSSMRFRQVAACLQCVQFSGSQDALGIEEFQSTDGTFAESEFRCIGGSAGGG